MDILTCHQPKSLIRADSTFNYEFNIILDVQKVYAFNYNIDETRTVRAIRNKLIR